jgi:hypothetical protein
MEADNVEVELKLNLPSNHEKVLTHLREHLLPGWDLVCQPSNTVIDTYFDSPGYVLFSKNTIFRVRRWRLPFKPRHRYNANFKYPPSHDSVWADLGFLVRTEIRSKIPTHDLSRCRDALLVGEAPALAYRAAATSNGSSRRGSIDPVIRATTHRDRYAVRSGPFDDAAHLAFGVMFETTTAIDITNEDTVALFETGVLSCMRPLHTFQFSGVEIEANLKERTSKATEESIQFADRVVNALRDDGMSPLTASKYAMAIEGLQLCTAEHAH